MGEGGQLAVWFLCDPPLPHTPFFKSEKAGQTKQFSLRLALCSFSAESFSVVFLNTFQSGGSSRETLGRLRTQGRPESRPFSLSLGAPREGTEESPTPPPWAEVSGNHCPPASRTERQMCVIVTPSQAGLAEGGGWAESGTSD